MKPHFRKVLGIWHCGIRGIPNKRIGLGYTPRQAYQDWLYATMSEPPNLKQP